MKHKKSSTSRVNSRIDLNSSICNQRNFIFSSSCCAYNLRKFRLTVLVYLKFLPTYKNLGKQSKPDIPCYMTEPLARQEAKQPQSSELRLFNYFSSFLSSHSPKRLPSGSVKNALNAAPCWVFGVTTFPPSSATFFRMDSISLTTM